MKNCPLVFFSFVSLSDACPEDHRRYNEWHQLHHRPENLALPGIAWGDRWARPTDCKEASCGSAEQGDTDYVAMYWFRDPVERSIRECEQLGADSFRWGRGPHHSGCSPYPACVLPSGERLLRGVGIGGTGSPARPAQRRTVRDADPSCGSVGGAGGRRKTRRTAHAIALSRRGSGQHHRPNRGTGVPSWPSRIRTPYNLCSTFRCGPSSREQDW